MKHKTSVALEEHTLAAMRELVRTGLFRNKSHVMEFAVKRLVSEAKQDDRST